MGKICIILGTRHEIIKMLPVVRACERQEGSDWFVVHTGQHYSHHMDRVFFEQLGLPDARYNLDCGSGSGRHGGQTERMLAGIYEKPFASKSLYEKVVSQKTYAKKKLNWKFKWVLESGKSLNT